MWTCHTFRWGPLSLCSCQSVRGTGWPPSISGKRIFKCRFILLLVTFFASCSVTRSTSSKLCALASPRLRRSSPGSWLLFQLYSILWVSVCVDTSTTGWSSLPLGSLSSRIFRLSSDFVTSWGSSSSQQVQPRTFPGSTVSRGRHRSTSFRASLSVERISRLQSTAAAFQSCASPTASLWLSLLGVLSSLAHLVPGGRLRMQSIQLFLHRSWNRQDLEAPVLVSMECLHDLHWWLHLPRLYLGVSLRQVSPDLHFWSDAPDVGWGAHLDCQVASGQWDPHQAALSITARELLAVQLGLFQFQSALQGRTVAVFCDYTTAVA